jgi:hypoxanthine-guanine phosphoribosyltransferase
VRKCSIIYLFSFVVVARYGYMSKSKKNQKLKFNQSTLGRKKKVLLLSYILKEVELIVALKKEHLIL